MLILPVLAFPVDQSTELGMLMLITIKSEVLSQARVKLMTQTSSVDTPMCKKGSRDPSLPLGVQPHRHERGKFDTGIPAAGALPCETSRLDTRLDRHPMRGEWGCSCT